MRVLITNDDGVEAPGLHALALAVHGAGHDVIVVAPSGERSGSGAAIGRLHRAGPHACTEVTWPEMPGVPVYAIDVPPAATVYAGALGAFGPPPDVVASGINPGMNYGHLVLHSGTVGAALTAAAIGIPAVAVSIGWGDDHHWSTASALAPAALAWVAAAPGAPCVLNVNVPNVAASALLGVRAATLAPFTEQWNASASPGEVRLEYVGRGIDPPDGTDLAAVLAGYAAVTTLRGIVPVADTSAAASIGASTTAALGPAAPR